MGTSITAVYEAGVLRPITPLKLPEGARVELMILGEGKNRAPSGRAAASILAEIAALPTSGGWEAVDAIHNRLAASGRPFTDSAEMLREDRER